MNRYIKGSVPKGRVKITRKRFKFKRSTKRSSRIDGLQRNERAKNDEPVRTGSRVRSRVYTRHMEGMRTGGDTS